MLVEGLRYVVTEWDGSQAVIVLMRIYVDEVVIRYTDDDCIQRVSQLYFKTALNPLPVN